MKRYILSLIINSIFAFTLLGQQYPIFTNYVLNDFGFNPAIAGTTDFLDAKFTYRTQWVGVEGAPKTQIVTAQGPLKKLPIGIGGVIYNDVAGHLKRTGMSLALSYGLEVGPGKLNIGASGGAYNLLLEEGYFAKNEQDPTLMGATEKNWIPDLNVGLYYQMDNGLFVGVSAPQILQKKLDFQQDQNIETTDFVPHFYGMAGYTLKLNEKIALQPSALFKYVQNAPIQVDFAVTARFNDRFWIGGSYRSVKNGSVMLGADLSKNLYLAYAHDFTFTDLNVGSKGTHEITLGFRMGGPKDTDEDGILDKDDECPEEPGTEENNGCPEEEDDPDDDKDGDGVLNKDDKCPDEPGMKSNEGCPLGDRDKDGLRDDLDQCPDEPGLPENKGCPLKDRDNDGIVDSKDKCPDEPGSMALEGCPDADRDGDGVVDALDKCPDTAGMGGKDGCPIVTNEELEILNLAIRNLYFDTDKDRIRQHSYRYLNNLAELMVSKPDWKLSIKGHTDDRGSEEYNIDLSKRRSETVMFYLMNRGVKRSQMIVEYYGESAPESLNVNEQGRQLNRRVELQFVFE